MQSAIRRLLAILLFSVSLAAQAQPADDNPGKKSPRPYTLVSSGKEVTIKSNRTIQHLMLWTSSGHRVIEQREINANTYTFTIPVNEKIFFLMVGLEGGKIYTEKLGIR